MPGLRSDAGRVATVAAALLLAAVPAAAAAPPPNDLRQSATALELPSTAEGTTVDATLSADESKEVAGTPIDGTVWYRLESSAAQLLVLDMTADGDLDAAVEIYRRARSQLRLEGSLLTDEDGRALLVNTLRAGSTYFIRVARLANSLPGTFTLRASVPKGPPPGPGRLMDDGSAKGTVDPLDETADAWSARLKAGTTYRINLVNRSSRRLDFAMYDRGTRSFASGQVVGSRKRYQLYTPGPGEGGRYSFLVTATGLGAPQRYALHVTRAKPDDLWPGRKLHNYERVAGSLNARGSDVVDTYRFDITSRSAVTVRMRPRGDADVRFTLRRADGSRLGGGSEDFERRLGVGRYVVTVSAAPGSAGRYTVWREARVITSLRLSTASPLLLGQTAVLRLQLSPGESGRATVEIDRFDPASGWHFDRVVKTTISGGTGTVAFRPPTQGRWRARAAFAGTKRAQASATARYLHFMVLTPLDPTR